MVTSLPFVSDVQEHDKEDNYLYIVFKAPLAAEIGLLPGGEHIQKGYVVSNVALREELVSIVCVHRLVFGSIEDSSTD